MTKATGPGVLLAIAVTTAVAVALAGNPRATAVLYGGLIVVATTLLQRWHLSRAERSAANDAGRILRMGYRCAVERMILTIALFLIGLASLKLDPLALLGGFVAAQVAMMLSRYWIKI